MAKADSFFSAGEINAMIARVLNDESCPQDRAALRQVERKYVADRTAKALNEWVSYSVAGHDGGANGLISAINIAIDTPPRLNNETGEMESQQYHLVSDTSTGCYSCDCHDYVNRIEPLNKALAWMNGQQFIPVECKHGKMIDKLQAREVEQERAAWHLESQHRDLAELEAASARIRATLGVEPAAALPDVAALLEQIQQLTTANELLSAQVADEQNAVRVWACLADSRNQIIDELRADLDQEKRTSDFWQADNERLKAASDRVAERNAVLEAREALTRRRFQALDKDARRTYLSA